VAFGSTQVRRIGGWNWAETPRRRRRRRKRRRRRRRRRRTRRRTILTVISSPKLSHVSRALM
jgi:hypothetical protein